MATATVNSALRPTAIFTRLNAFCSGSHRSSAALITSATLAFCALVATSATLADTAADLDVLRVDVPLEGAKFVDGELQLSTLITNNTYIDVEDFNLRAVELEASSTANGEVRLKVGRYVTPPVPLPDPDNQGLLRIEAPHKSNKSWRLQFENRARIKSLTAVLEPRNNDAEYISSRYENRGYTLGQDNNYRAFSTTRNDSWPYGWLSNRADSRSNLNRRAAHWYWLNNPRSSTFLNSAFGNTTFNRGRIRTIAPITQGPVNSTISTPQPVAPAVPATGNAQANQAAQAALQQRAAQAQAQQIRQQQIRAQQIRQQRQQQQQRRDAFERRNNRSFGTTGGTASDRSTARQRRSIQQRNPATTTAGSRR